LRAGECIEFNTVVGRLKRRLFLLMLPKRGRDSSSNGTVKVSGTSTEDSTELKSVVDKEPKPTLGSMTSTGLVSEDQRRLSWHVCVDAAAVPAKLLGTLGAYRFDMK
jgi:hypothetical protein